MIARRVAAARFMEGSVIVDHRYYRIKPGMVSAYLDLYQKHGYAAQTRHLGKPLAYLFSESGELNTLVHLWAYESAGERERKRAAMFADPEWLNYVRQNTEAGLLVEQRTNLMVPAGFAPITPPA
jgi:hypothetical protein